ncbi:MAG TPA: GatB/YqeY domain-containing protein [Bacteroidota bacterium]|nr:GatB/YqeY domain-containing protein [Bacteroidota bacterium]
MNLTQRISEDLKSAMKSGDQLLLNTVRSIRAQLIEFSKREGAPELTPDDEVAILLSAAKKRKEAIEIYEKAGRNDLADVEKRELDIISSYLPKQMSREEAEEFIAKIIAQVGATSAKDFGKVMPLAMKELKGKIDGRTVQELVRAKLGE